MRRYLLPALALVLLGTLSGCATMSKKECLNADWRAIGYSDGARGTPYSHLAARRKSCSEYQVVPDDTAYMAGWHDGIKTFCTSARGYQFGIAGQPYPRICPQDVEADFLAGWQQGVRQYCTQENGLRQGLQGRGYRGVCPAELAPAFLSALQRGLDVRQARIAYGNMSRRLARERQEWRAEKDTGKRRQAAHEVAGLQEETDRLYDVMTVREACISPDWFNIGQRDGQMGRPNRATDLAYGCGGSGTVTDVRGYDAGWRQGIAGYCTYESGLEVGANNLPYRGVCSGLAHQRFWRGYEEGRDRFRREGYRQMPRRESGHAAPAARPAPSRNDRLLPRSGQVHKPRPQPARQAKPQPHARPQPQPARQAKPQSHARPQPHSQQQAKPRQDKQPATGKPGKRNAHDQQTEGKNKVNKNLDRTAGKKEMPEEDRGSSARPVLRSGDH